MASQGLQSALIVEIPEAEPAVARYRDRLDASAPLGVPAHVTVLFPFMPPETIDPVVLAELERLFAGVSRFRFQLDHTDHLRPGLTLRSDRHEISRQITLACPSHSFLGRGVPLNRRGVRQNVIADKYYRTRR